MKLGLPRGVIELAEPNPQWKNAANETIERLRNIFGAVAVDIQHIGSTAIDNIKAKPIIDIGVLITDFSKAEKKYDELARSGFSNRGMLLDKQSVVFSMGEDTPDDRITTHYIHIVQYGDTDWNDYITFRDYLNAHPSVAKEYETIKINLASLFPYDEGRLKYVDGKSDFINQTLKDARKNTIPKGVFQ
ncbi:MAG: GrpB family protein [Defluviitaleaceae bacterium]|nr:GrpB family protein [Defluviitaleaceae bacterium]MCL2275200.1 GrpB family protein [Defluviitaleaceae bacterium]